jgi:hypothetical protein
MSRKKNPLHRPRARPRAELIVKANVEWSTGYKDLLASGVFILGNQDGLRWLSEYISSVAARIDEAAPFSRNDPDHHEHINFDGPLNTRLSDEMGIMVGSFTRKDRKRVLDAGMQYQSRAPTRWQSCNAMPFRP